MDNRLYNLMYELAGMTESQVQLQEHSDEFYSPLAEKMNDKANQIIKIIEGREIPPVTILNGRKSVAQGH